MSEPSSGKGLMRRLIQVAVSIVVLGASVYGYRFGVRAGGTVLGVVMAVNAAVFCAILLSAFQMRPWRRDRRDR